jgi:hypothetical protein
VGYILGNIGGGGKKKQFSPINNHPFSPGIYINFCRNILAAYFEYSGGVVKNIPLPKILDILFALLYIFQRAPIRAYDEIKSITPSWLTR